MNIPRMPEHRELLREDFAALGLEAEYLRAREVYELAVCWASVMDASASGPCVCCQIFVNKLPGGQDPPSYAAYKAALIEGDGDDSIEAALWLAARAVLELIARGLVKPLEPPSGGQIPSRPGISSSEITSPPRMNMTLGRSLGRGMFDFSCSSSIL